MGWGGERVGVESGRYVFFVVEKWEKDLYFEYGSGKIEVTKLQGI